MVRRSKILLGLWHLRSSLRSLDEEVLGKFVLSLGIGVRIMPPPYFAYFAGLQIQLARLQ